MRLTVASHEHLQKFFRVHYRDAGLALPLIEWDLGAGAQMVTRAGAITAMTLGKRVLTARHALRQDAAGRWWIKGRLAAHEATHVLQYQKQGWGRFLWNYLGDYAGAMQEAARWNAAAHFRSYQAINAEREAQAAEDAYALWSDKSEVELTA